MRTLIANFTIDPMTGGGTAQRTLGLCRAMGEAGIDVALLTTGATRLASAADVTGVREQVVIPALFKRHAVPLIGVGRLVRLVRGVDVIFMLNHWTLLNALVYLAARLVGRPFILCPAGALPATGRSPLAKRLYTGLVGNRMLRDAARVVATTPLEARELEAYGVPSRKLCVIPNGFDPSWEPAADPAAFRAQYGLGDAPFALFLGRLHWSKGLDILIEGFARVAARVPEWRLVLAGPDHGLRAALEARAAHPDLQGRVLVIGPLTRAASMSACAAADLLVLASRRETMSIVALEAAALGTPALVTPAVGFDDVERVGGGRVVPGTVDGLAAGLLDLLTRRPELPAMGERLRAFTLQEFHWRRVGRRHIDLVAEVVAERAAPPVALRID